MIEIHRSPVTWPVTKFLFSNIFCICFSCRVYPILFSWLMIYSETCIYQYPPSLPRGQHSGHPNANKIIHDDVIKWKHFPRYWPFVRGIHRLPVNSPHKGQWRGALMFSLIYAWIKCWINNREAGDLRRHRAHHDVIVMHQWYDITHSKPQQNTTKCEPCS